MMKLTPGTFLPLTLVACLITAVTPVVCAQTTTTVTVEPTPIVAPVDQTTTTTTVTTVQPTPVVVPQPGQHVAEIELAVSHGKVQAYFGRASRDGKFEIGDLKVNIKLPSTATVTKLASRDDDSDGSKHVTPDNPWHVTVPFDGGGRYVFNIVDWDNDPVVVSAVVKVDGEVLFSGRGSEDDFNGWAQKSYAAGVRKTGSREIAFIVPSAR